MEFAYRVDVRVRYRDLDHMAHVNNAVYATYLEEARVGYFRDVIGVPVDEATVALASLELSFERRITLSDSVEVAVRVPELGETSLPMTYEVRADGDLAATGETVLVALDPDTNRPRGLPPAWRERIVEHEPHL